MNPYPSHVRSLLGWKTAPSRGIEALVGGDLYLFVSQLISLVLGIEKPTPSQEPLALIQA